LDRRWKIPAFLILGASIVAATGADFPIKEAKWLSPESRLTGLSSSLQECAAQPNTSERRAYSAGAVAFRTPLLLGGQAARAGLSCASCHENGRVTAGFQFPGLSGRPGTADVSSSIMSKTRGDGLFNPKPIPDLAADPPKISRDSASPALRAFIRSLIVDEFDGPEPDAAILDGLATYVRALSDTQCDTKSRSLITLSSHLAELNRSQAEAEHFASNKNPNAAWLMIAGSRTLLSKINDRYPTEQLRAFRGEIVAVDRQLQRLQTSIRSGEKADFGPTNRQIEKMGARLASRLSLSLYDPKRLAQALEGVPQTTIPR
jgi:hypothetical protein